MEREDSKDSREDSEEHDTKDPKRKKKTPLQIEMLERAYAEDTHPSESLRLELSTKLGLTNRQLQMWFCNRRLKDRKGIKDEFNTSTSQSKEEQFFYPKETPTFYEYPEAVLASEIEDDALFRRNVRQQVAQESEERISEVERKRSKHEIDGAKLPKKTSQQTVSDLDSRAAAISILSSWGETFREDGPTLGFEFDPLPPGAFGMPIEPGRYSNSIATLEHYDAMNIVKQDGNPSKSVAGAKASCSSLKPTFMNLPRDKQLVELAREQELPHGSGGIPKVRKINSLAPQHVQHAARMISGHQIELDDVQHVQGVLKRPSTVVPASRQTLRPPKRLLSPSIKTYMKKDGYGFEGRLKNGGSILGI
ncbi:hypothetical protein O6H91_09G094600 [Diphasiastrum complanatum]|uniref:Uncharacterized protein n=1 Tax=Diphasiastrum complanatum TaxID=34168 RepID=A0ACC2CRV2_DIPCM|nr:hypothetical protein O6H91_09G094600 [Diphasiastrum complanatum]